MHQTQTCMAYLDPESFYYRYEYQWWFITWSSWDFMPSCHGARKWCLPGKPAVSNMKLPCQKNTECFWTKYNKLISSQFLPILFMFQMFMVVLFNCCKPTKSKNWRLKAWKRSSCLEIIWTHHSEVLCWAKWMTSKKPSAICEHFNEVGRPTFSCISLHPTVSLSSNLLPIHGEIPHQFLLSNTPK